jgi:hypothetical protein
MEKNITGSRIKGGIQGLRLTIRHDNTIVLSCYSPEFNGPLFMWQEAQSSGSTSNGFDGNLSHFLALPTSIFQEFTPESA